MKFKIVLLIGFILVLNIVFNPRFDTKAEGEKVLDIDTFPREKFLEMDQLKPGDKIISSLDVLNKGNILFSYSTKAEFSGGSREYYDALEIKIKDQKDQLLFEGKLKDFKGLDPREILIFNKDSLYFEINVPHELGNEYQGLSSKVKLIFSASEDPVLGGGVLPNTGTQNYNLILGGILLLVCGAGMYLFTRKITRVNGERWGIH